jgi:hypothetical protein
MAIRAVVSDIGGVLEKDNAQAIAELENLLTAPEPPA